MALSLRDQFGLVTNPWEAQSVSLCACRMVCMMRICAYFSLWFWSSVSLSWQLNHLCWRHIDFGFFLCLVSDCSSVCSYVSFLSLAPVPDSVVVFPSWGGVLLADDSWRGSSCVLVTLPERRCLFSYLFFSDIVLFLAELVNSHCLSPSLCS